MSDWLQWEDVVFVFWSVVFVAALVGAAIACAVWVLVTIL